MKKKSFVDEDWTGLSHQQIKSMILQEEKKRQMNPLRDELEKLHDDCKDGNHKWEQEKLTVCSVCGMYQDEYNDRMKKIDSISSRK